MNSILCRSVLGLGLVTSICSYTSTTSTLGILNRPNIKRDSKITTIHDSNCNTVYESDEPYCIAIKDSTGRVIGVEFYNLEKDTNDMLADY